MQNYSFCQSAQTKGSISSCRRRLSELEKHLGSIAGPHKSYPRRNLSSGPLIREDLFPQDRSLEEDYAEELISLEETMPVHLR